MSSIKTRLHSARHKFLRRTSGTGGTSASETATRPVAASAGSDRVRPLHGQARSPALRQSTSLSKLPRTSSPASSTADERLVRSELLPSAAERPGSDRHSPEASPAGTTGTDITTASESPLPPLEKPPAAVPACPALTLEEPTPLLIPAPARPPTQAAAPAESSASPAIADAPAAMLAPPPRPSPSHRKIWVRRPNASATLVQIREDALVDDVRDMILQKYANSLGRSFDSPDVTLRIVPRDPQHEGRSLGPEEDMCQTLDVFFPGGQQVNEALLIDVPQRRTPKLSPRVPLYYAHHDDSQNHQTEYFPPMLPVANPSPAAIVSLSASQHERIPLNHAPHSIAVLNTGQLPALPSPGGSTRRGHHSAVRPRNARHNTASPTTLTGGIPSSATSTRPPNRLRRDSSASETKHSASSNNPIPSPPIPTAHVAQQPPSPSTPRVASPQPTKKRRKKQILEVSALPAGLLDGSVPPINVLIVEDNIINLRVLGQLMQRLKVRWQRAMNGKEAVTKWKAGGFHLILMDIQLPVMNGLEATKEIRRLERVNNIGVFSSGSNEAPNQRLGQEGKIQEDLGDEDKLGDKGLFKSPVIIVALTASSLQSDRHEALAAGCNDFLTKPVSFVWLERKVKEWGCMQALIDFDGWRKWKDFAEKSESTDATSKLSASYSSIAPSKPAKKDNTLVSLSGSNSEVSGNEEKDKEGKDRDLLKEKKKRKSLGIVPPPVLPEESETPTPEGGM